MTKKTRVLIVENHEQMRAGLNTMLSMDPGYEVVDAVPDREPAIRAAMEHLPDVVLMSLSKTRAGGIDAIARIRKAHPDIKIIAMTFHREDQYVHATFEAGADGYVLKDDRRRELFNALGSVMNGQNYLSAGLGSCILPPTPVGVGPIPNN